MVDFIDKAISFIGHRIKLHAAADYVGVPSAALKQALYLSLREIISKTENPALKKLYMPSGYYGSELYLAIYNRGSWEDGGAGFYNFREPRKISLIVPHNFAAPDSLSALEEIFQEGLGLKPRRRTTGFFKDTEFYVERGELLRAFRMTDHEVFRCAFKDIERILSFSRHAASVAARWIAPANFKDVLMASMAQETFGEEIGFPSDRLDKFFYDLARLPVREPKVVSVLAEKTIHAASQVLASWDLPALSYLGCGHFSIAFTAHPDHQGRQQVVVISPEGEGWPDTPYHAPAYAYAPLEGGGFIRVMPYLPGTNASALTDNLFRRGLSDWDVEEKNVGRYDYCGEDEKKHAVTFLRDWGCGPVSLSEKDRDDLWNDPKLRSFVEVHKQVVSHGIHGATRHIPPEELNAPSATRVGLKFVAQPLSALKASELAS